MKFSKIKFLIGFFIFSGFVSAQSNISAFSKPTDSLYKSRLKTVIISEAVFASSVLIGLNQLWYKDFPKSDFHFVNDNSEWLQMDIIGHFYTCYHLGKLGAESLKWSGANQKSQLLYGATLGLAFMSVVEVFDGQSSQWGFSVGDMTANVLGTGFYVSQDLLWKEQRIVPKFSFHQTVYAAARPNVLGNSFNEQIIKDYNGQTYWLSTNVHSFFKTSKMPKFINLAMGYGAEGMITGKESFINTVFLPEKSRIRQFYLSLDVDLTKIKTKSNTLKTIFSFLNTIKIPAPTFEINGRGKTKFHYFYF